MQASQSAVNIHLFSSNSASGIFCRLFRKSLASIHLFLILADEFEDELIYIYIYFSEIRNFFSPIVVLYNSRITPKKPRLVKETIRACI